MTHQFDQPRGQIVAIAITRKPQHVRNSSIIFVDMIAETFRAKLDQDRGLAGIRREPHSAVDHDIGLIAVDSAVRKSVSFRKRAAFFSFLECILHGAYAPNIALP